jgi:carbon-monoxide dehydrogenase large subunit
LFDEFAEVSIDDDGGATIRVGTSAHGQGHVTTFSHLLSDALGVPVNAIRVVQSDTALVPRGRGSGASRSLQVGGSAVLAAADKLLERSRELVSRLLEVDPADIEVGEGGLYVAGVPSRVVEWQRLAELARSVDGLPLSQAVDHVNDGETYPFGAHVSVVEVDLDTGKVDVLRHVAVDDCGRVVNPTIVTGQQHGGIAAGISHTLWEHFRYDEDGNPKTSTFADYGIATSAELPTFEATTMETPTSRNVLGAKGIGESGTVGAAPAVHNAVLDAVSHLGVTHFDAPCAPHNVWSAIQAAMLSRLPSPWRDPPDVMTHGGDQSR